MSIIEFPEGTLSSGEAVSIRKLCSFDDETVLTLFRTLRPLRRRFTRHHCHALFSLIDLGVDDEKMRDSLATFRGPLGSPKILLKLNELFTDQVNLQKKDLASR